MGGAIHNKLSAKGWLLVLCTFVCFSVIGQQQESSSLFKWPNGAKVAICLTYDDGLASHVKYVYKELNKHGLKGTFFVNGHAKSFRKSKRKWRKLVKSGHELGNHTMYHPCQKVKKGREPFDWLAPEHDFNHYTKKQLITELKMADSALRKIDGLDDRTYAYTCSDHVVSGESFIEDIRPMFTAARIDGPIPETMDEVDLMYMPSWPVNGHTGQDMINYVKAAADKGTIGTIMFHGVGGEHLKVSRGAHKELIAHLAAHPDIYYVDTFKNITDYIRQSRELKSE